MSNFRIGMGVDHHRLVPAPSSSGFSLTLGGYQIPRCKLALEGNSDSDVIIHALCNALSTALGGGSLAPITDPLCQQGLKESHHYLAHFNQLMHEAGYQLSNLSLSVEAKEPPLETHGAAIRQKLANLLNLQTDQIGLAFTSGEGLTACGQGKGIYAQAICLLEKKEHVG